MGNSSLIVINDFNGNRIIAIEDTYDSSYHEDLLRELQSYFGLRRIVDTYRNEQENIAAGNFNSMNDVALCLIAYLKTNEKRLSGLAHQEYRRTNGSWIHDLPDNAIFSYHYYGFKIATATVDYGDSMFILYPKEIQQRIVGAEYSGHGDARINVKIQRHDWTLKTKSKYKVLYDGPLSTATIPRE